MPGQIQPKKFIHEPSAKFTLALLSLSLNIVSVIVGLLIRYCKLKGHFCIIILVKETMYNFCFNRLSFLDLNEKDPEADKYMNPSLGYRIRVEWQDEVL